MSKDSISSCAYIIHNGKNIPVSEVTRNGSILTLNFRTVDVSVDIKLSQLKESIVFEIQSMRGECESLNFLNVPLSLKGKTSEPFAACALSLNLKTKVNQMPALQTQLWANGFRRFGIVGSRVAVIGVPQQEILQAIRNIITESGEIPSSIEGGAWAQLGKEGSGSYLINFGTLTEQTADEWIAMCKSIGFTQIDSHGSIDNHQGNTFFRFGDFQLNPEKWPDGWESFKRINKRLKEAGISHIFHTYAFFIDKNSKYVTPVPSPDLGYIRAFTITRPITEEATEIQVEQSTLEISPITGWHVENSNTLRINQELVTFDSVSRKAPFRFIGCKRGAHGTKISSHPANEQAYQLKELFGLFLPGANTRLFEEVAKRTAQIINECQFSGLYLDAIDGSHILEGKDFAWYYGTKFIFEIAKYLDHPVGMEMSAMSHHWWHLRSRWQAWDRPIRGYKRFVDIHVAAITDNKSEHVHWKENASQPWKHTQMENGRLLLPLHLGWWGHQTWNPPQSEPTFSDDVEYLCCKMIGNKAGLSMLGGADEATVKQFPLYGRLNEIIRQYEELRHKNYFSDTLRSLLRIPGREYTLFKENDGGWNFKPVTFSKHKVTGQHQPSEHWTVENTYGDQPVRLRIELLMAARKFNDSKNIVLADFSREALFKTPEQAKGVSCSLNSMSEKAPDGSLSAQFSAFNNGESPREGSWLSFEKSFWPVLDLSKNQGLGVWIKGDGNGQLLSLRLKHKEQLMVPGRGDHFIKINFKGWKYFELVEFESTEYSNYLWSSSGKFGDFDVYQTYRNPVIMSMVDRLQLLFNNISPQLPVSCQIGQIKALPLVTREIQNPSIMIGKQKITFPVTMVSGMYIEYNPGRNCTLYSSTGEVLREVIPEGKAPLLHTGSNQVTFQSEGSDDLNTRAQITVITEGKPFCKRLIRGKASIPGIRPLGQ